MPDFPAPNRPVTPTHVSNAAMDNKVRAGGIPAVGTWVANLAVYMPFVLPWPYLVRRVWWMNGSTITSTNVDMGIYTDELIQLYHTGSTAMSGASSVQYVALGTEMLLSPGLYWLAWTCSNTTSRSFRFAQTATDGRTAGLLQESSALPLPATATPVAYAGQGMPYCGLTRTSSGF